MTLLQILLSGRKIYFRRGNSDRRQSHADLGGCPECAGDADRRGSRARARGSDQSCDTARQRLIGRYLSVGQSHLDLSGATRTALTALIAQVEELIEEVDFLAAVKRRASKS